MTQILLKNNKQICIISSTNKCWRCLFTQNKKPNRYTNAKNSAFLWQLDNCILSENSASSSNHTVKSRVFPHRNGYFYFAVYRAKWKRRNNIRRMKCVSYINALHREHVRPYAYVYVQLSGSMCLCVYVYFDNRERTAVFMFDKRASIRIVFISVCFDQFTLTQSRCVMKQFSCSHQYNCSISFNCIFKVLIRIDVHSKMKLIYMNEKLIDVIKRQWDRS